MSHSKDKTLLAKLGFNDPDRAGKWAWMHDRACAYLAETDALVRIVKSRDADGSVTVTNVRTSLEVPITKGEGQYRTTVGFADMLASADCSIVHPRLGALRLRLLIEVKTRQESVGEWLRQMRLYGEYAKLIPYGGFRIDETEELGFYELSGASSTVARFPLPQWAEPRMILACCEPFSKATAGALRAAGIQPVHLGKPFQDWLLASMATPSPDDDTLEI